MKKLKGKCLCGVIEYEIEGKLGPTVNCHYKVLGHMNDFKRCIKVGIYYDGLNFNAINWGEVMHSINNMPIGTQGYKYATELAIELFSELTTNTSGKLI